MEDRNKICELSSEIRRLIEAIGIPEDIHEELTRHLSRLGEENAYAIRSSATAEDLPTASFAGQQGTNLNVIGKQAILNRVSKCWASLYTERAVVYRVQNGFDHRRVRLAVVVQKMIFPEAAGILFTADPVTSNRKVSSIDASFGLGEALVSGLVNADVYKVRNGKVVTKKISTKKLAVFALQEMAARKSRRSSLSGRIGKRSRTIRFCSSRTWAEKIEEHFGHPQDIEWVPDGRCVFYIVQSAQADHHFIPDS